MCVSFPTWWRTCQRKKGKHYYEIHSSWPSCMFGLLDNHAQNQAVSFSTHCVLHNSKKNDHVWAVSPAKCIYWLMKYFHPHAPIEWLRNLKLDNFSFFSTSTGCQRLLSSWKIYRSSLTANMWKLGYIGGFLGSNMCIENWAILWGFLGVILKQPGQFDKVYRGHQ